MQIPILATIPIEAAFMQPSRGGFRPPAQTIVQPVTGAQFPMSYAMVGSVIPGEQRRYPVRIVNFDDLSSAVRHRPKPVDPVKKHMSMHDEQTKGHPLMDKLKQMLQQKGKPQMQEGYERMKEDLAWKGTPMQSGASIFGV